MVKEERQLIEKLADKITQACKEQTDTFKKGFESINANISVMISEITKLFKASQRSPDTENNSSKSEDFLTEYLDYDDQ